MKVKNVLFIQRIVIWILYLLSGLIIYTREGYLSPFLIYFTKIIYPLSIFWLQIRIKRKGKFLPIDNSMTTSQLWFNILPVFASLITVILTFSNALLYILSRFI